MPLVLHSAHCMLHIAYCLLLTTDVFIRPSSVRSRGCPADSRGLPSPPWLMTMVECSLQPHMPRAPNIIALPRLPGYAEGIPAAFACLLINDIPNYLLWTAFISSLNILFIAGFSGDWPIGWHSDLMTNVAIVLQLDKQSLPATTVVEWTLQLHTVVYI